MHYSELTANGSTAKPAKGVWILQSIKICTERRFSEFPKTPVEILSTQNVFRSLLAKANALYNVIKNASHSARRAFKHLSGTNNFYFDFIL